MDLYVYLFRYADYSHFVIGAWHEKYQLNIGTYSGNAGDSLTRQNSMYFSTVDRDNDKDATNHCATLYPGAWWHNDCIDSKLTGNAVYKA